MTAQQINAALDIQESYQMPDALMKKITGPDAEAQNIVVHRMNRINQWIDEENDALEKWQRIKRAMLGNLFA